MKCLVTKLNGSVNASLPMLGMYSVYAKATSANSHFYLSVKNGQSVTVKSDIAFDAKNGDHNGPTTTLASSVKEFVFTYNAEGNNYFYVSCPNNGKENLFYISKNNTTSISDKTESSKVLNIKLNIQADTFKFNPDLQTLNVSKIIGDFSVIDCANLKVLKVIETEGNVPIELLRNITTLNISGSKNNAKLDLSSLSGEYGSKLTNFQFYNTKNITGDILEWAKRMQQAGRTSGTLQVQGVTSNATIGEYSWSAKDKIITFSESDCTVTDKD